MAISKPCPRPHCGRLIPLGATYCPRHQAERDRALDAQRKSASARGYDWRWAQYSQRWLRRFPWCGQRRDGKLYDEHSACVRAGMQVRAAITDHIRSLRDGGAMFDPANHQSLCVSCNTRKG
jgi:5-methylcytosine-specific restriction endonuclease McrA